MNVNRYTLLDRYTLLACIPIIGIIPSFIMESSINKIIADIGFGYILHRTERITKVNNVIKLIRIKNHYKISSIIRDFLSVVLLVSVVACNVLVVAMIEGSSLIGHTRRIYKNKQLIDELQRDGFPSSGIINVR